MPKALEAKLKKEALLRARQGKLHKRKGETSKQAQDRYTYGTLRKTGWVPSTQKHQQAIKT